jgi:hypothetical protein
MSRIINREKVEFALNRAARSAKRGPPEYRAGRFIARRSRDSQEDAESIKNWMDQAIMDLGFVERGLYRKGDILKFRDDLSWTIEIDGDGRFYVHYICEVPKECILDRTRFFAGHVKLYTEKEFREHVRQAVLTFDC